jgi:hypothetical protein
MYVFTCDGADGFVSFRDAAEGFFLLGVVMTVPAWSGRTWGGEHAVVKLRAGAAASKTDPFERIYWRSDRRFLHDITSNGHAHETPSHST